MSLMLQEDEGFSLTANVTAPGYQRVVLRGYLVSHRPDGMYVTPLIPQLFYGADGRQLTSWRQYIPSAGSQVMLSRSSGLPKVPREELFWRRVSAAAAPLRAYSVGRRITGPLRPLIRWDTRLPLEALGESIPGAFYELRIETDGIPDPRRAVEALVGGLRDRGVGAVWATADGQQIRLQVAGSPFAWAALLPFIPLILSAVGVAVIFIAVFQIFGAIPSWAWGLLAVGLLFVFVVPALIKPPRRY